MFRIFGKNKKNSLQQLIDFLLSFVAKKDGLDNKSSRDEMLLKSRLEEFIPKITPWMITEFQRAPMQRREIAQIFFKEMFAIDVNLSRDQFHDFSLFLEEAFFKVNLQRFHDTFSDAFINNLPITLIKPKPMTTIKILAAQRAKAIVTPEQEDILQVKLCLVSELIECQERLLMKKLFAKATQKLSRSEEFWLRGSGALLPDPKEYTWLNELNHSETVMASIPDEWVASVLKTGDVEDESALQTEMITALEAAIQEHGGIKIQCEKAKQASLPQALFNSPEVLTEVMKTAFAAYQQHKVESSQSQASGPSSRA